MEKPNIYQRLKGIFGYLGKHIDPKRKHKKDIIFDEPKKSRGHGRYDILPFGKKSRYYHRHKLVLKKGLQGGKRNHV